MSREQRVCMTCHKRFDAINDRQRFCSKPCYLIEKFTPERVVDIKYSSAIDGRSHEHYYSAMVILKDEEDKKDGNETSM